MHVNKVNKHECKQQENLFQCSYECQSLIVSEKIADNKNKKWADR